MRLDFIARLGVELVIVLVGVLLAFQFEGWRERRAEIEREGSQLRALKADFSANRQRLAETVAMERRVLPASEAVLRLFRDGASGDAPDTLTYLVTEAMSWYRLEPVTGAYGALVGSGDLGLLRSDDLRRRLAEFYGEIDAGFEDHDSQMDALGRLVQEAGAQLQPILLPDLDAGVSWGQTGDVNPEVVEAFLSNTALPGLMTWKALLSVNRLQRLEMLAAAADTIAQLIEVELGGE